MVGQTSRVSDGEEGAGGTQQFSQVLCPGCGAAGLLQKARPRSGVAELLVVEEEVGGSRWT